MKTPPKHLVALFLLAVVGVLIAVGAVLGRALGPVAVTVYAVLLVAIAVVGAQQVRGRLRAAAARAAGRTCTCCSGTVHDPVKVV